MTNLLWLLVSVLVQVESGGRNIGGDRGYACGVLQQQPVSVRECNRLTGWHRWELEDRWDAKKSREMCFVTLKHHYERGVVDPVELAAKWRNPSAHNQAPGWYKERIRAELLSRRAVVELAKGE